MAITFVDKGTFTSGTGALTVPVPASYVARDLFLLMICTANAATTTVPAGWSTLIGSPLSRGTINTVGGIKFEVLYKFASETEASVSLTQTGLNYRTAQITAWRGVSVGTPFDATPTTQIDATAIANFSCPAITTSTASAMVINAIGLDRDLNSTTLITATANASLASITVGHQQTITTGVGGGSAFFYGIKTVAGAVNATTATESATAGFKVYFTIALKPMDSRSGTSTISQTSTVTSIGIKRGVGLSGISQTSTLTSTGIRIANKKGSFLIFFTDRIN
ncbi:MAG: hypothetical protein WCO84_01345 [bacterium]